MDQLRLVSFGFRLPPVEIMIRVRVETCPAADFGGQAKDPDFAAQSVPWTGPPENRR
jgi:hypothetical protein